MRGCRAILTELGLVTACVAAAASAHAATINFSGDLSNDDQVAYYFLNVTGSSAVTLETTSYATGGFPTVISLFSPTGGFLATSGATGASTCSGPGQTAVAPVGGASPVCGDAYLTDTLTTGTYLAALSEFPNFPSVFGTTVDAGFQFANQSNFTNGSNGCGVGGSAGFYDLVGDCEQRTGAYSLSISGVTSATAYVVTTTPLPEPVSLLLTAPALLWLVLRRRTATTK